WDLLGGRVAAAGPPVVPAGAVPAAAAVRFAARPAQSCPLRAVPRPGAARVRPLLSVRTARPAGPGPARRRRGAHLLCGQGHRVRGRPMALQVLAGAERGRADVDAG